MTGDPTKGATVTMLIFLLKALVGYREDQTPKLEDAAAVDVRKELGLATDAEVDKQLEVIQHMTLQERFQYLEILQNAKAGIDAGEPPATQQVVLQRHTAEEAEGCTRGSARWRTRRPGNSDIQEGV
ncbi:MAG: hypothetical protein ACLQAT_14715 [Candidatus Binataceae bacterium]